MLRQPPRFRDALEVLASHHVDFIVVGGVAGVLAGAPISTFDLDIVHDRAPPNVARLLSALTDLDARYRDPAGRVLRPEAEPLTRESRDVAAGQPFGGGSSSSTRGQSGRRGALAKTELIQATWGLTRMPAA